VQEVTGEMHDSYVIISICE